MKKGLQLYTIALALFLTFAIFSSYSRKTAPAKANTEQYSANLPQIVKPINLDRPFDFAGELLPMENFDVRERLDRELLVNSYWHSSTMLNIKSASKYFPIIEPILAKNGVPDDFKYLAVAESNLRNVTSPAGAKGIWQFMTPIAKSFKLEVNKEVDERYHIEKATQAACEYFLDHYRRFGSWTLTAASYNMGATRLSRDLKNQRASDYYDLNLNAETSRYVFRLIAIKEILNTPRAFGFYVDKEDGYQPLDDYEVIEVSTAIENWGDFAREYGTNYRILKVYNPWLISNKLTNPKRKTYQIKLPKKSIKVK